MAYTYEKQLWKDYPDTSTPITADRLNHMEDGIAEAAKNGGGESDKVGVVKMFSGSTAPEGWLICDGSAVSRTTYSELFSIIGTTYGKGDGSTTFNLPNIKGRTVVGLNSSDTDFKTLGKTGGEKTHKLTVNEMPSHGHNIMTRANWSSTNNTVGVLSRSTTSNGTDELKDGSVFGARATGGDKPHNNLQPYIVLNYIIKASTTTPVQGEIIDSLDGNSTTNAPSVHAVNQKLSELVDKYSTDEIIIGTYLGKPHYRKVLNLGTITGTTTTRHQTGLTNVKYLTKFEGTCICENTYGMKLPTNGDQIDSVIFRARLENSFSILKTERTNNSFQNVFFTIEYTKTTD